LPASGQEAGAKMGRLGAQAVRSDEAVRSWRHGRRAWKPWALGSARGPPELNHAAGRWPGHYGVAGVKLALVELSTATTPTSAAGVAGGQEFQLQARPSRSPAFALPLCGRARVLNRCTRNGCHQARIVNIRRSTELGWLHYHRTRGWAARLCSRSSAIASWGHII
jgi:hypothetical protein